MNDNLNSSENVVEGNNQQSLQESSTNWDEESLAKLLGYDNSENKDNTVSKTEIETIDEEEPTSNNSQVVNDTEVGDSNNNVVDTHELFDDPHDGKTQPTFATNPFAKFGAVGLILLVVFGTGATFLNSIISGKPRTAQLISDNKTEKPKVIFEENTKPIENENGKLKAELALSTQREKIKSVSSESENTKTPIPKNNSQAPQKLNEDNIKTPQKNIASEPRPPVISRPPVYRTIPRRTVQNNYPARSHKIAPSLPPTPRTTVKEPLPSPIPSPVKRISPPPPPATPEKPAEIDPKQQWLAVNQLGSYGTAQITPFTEEKNEQKSQEEVKPAVDEKPILPTTIPSATPLMVSQTYENTTYPEPLYREEAKILNTECFYNESCPFPKQIVKQLKIGSTITGRLITPLTWDKNSASNTNPKQSNFNHQENFIIQTTESLKDRNGLITLPKNTQIVATINSIPSSGLVQLQAQQIIINGKQYILPKQSISIRGNKGNPLIASKRSSKGKDIAARDAETFVVGSLAKVGKVLNQPKSEQFSTSSGFGGNSSFSSIRRSDSDILGAVLEGGFEPLTEQIVERNKRKKSEIKQQQKVWYVPANTRVQIFVNQSFQFSD
ncbi:MAG: conjugal transfer protein TrbI [Rivularia sp. (in: Bacteria)]|nr:conjugal transfer protein TrbI [Rivularia sp. MS3]